MTVNGEGGYTVPGYEEKTLENQSEIWMFVMRMQLPFGEKARK